MANLRKMLLFKMLLLLFILVACKKKEYIIFIKGLKKVTLVQLYSTKIFPVLLEPVKMSAKIFQLKMAIVERCTASKLTYLILLLLDKLTLDFVNQF